MADKPSGLGGGGKQEKARFTHPDGNHQDGILSRPNCLLEVRVLPLQQKSRLTPGLSFLVGIGEIITNP
ncbi:MAG: hypothetical protein EBU52_12495 [Cytophagia bacterium]|nr:hypothetical protein [Cytophagia bacterium]